MMSAGRAAAQRLQRGYRGDTRPAASAGDRLGSADAGATVTVHVPLEFRQRRGRKVLVAPDGAGQEQLGAPRGPAQSRDEVTPAARALARAFRWRRLLETGVMATVQEIAAAETINPSYVSRVLRLTLLAPEIIEAVMEEIAVGDAVTLDRLMQPFPIDWGRQALLGY